MTSRDATRIKDALWGLFVADALAMPAHWFYSRDNIKKEFGPDGVREFHAARHPHPESFMVGMNYDPDVEKAKGAGRPFDILHKHRRFYRTTYSELEIDTSARESEHGNAAPKEDERYHYHHGLEAGENTLAANLARVLLRSVAQNGRYDHQAFLRDFVAYMTAPGKNNDPYSEIYVRRWFENYSTGQDIELCAATQRDIWSIGSCGGVIRPLILSLLADNAYQGVGLAVDHQSLTHRSQLVSSALGVTVPLLNSLVSGAGPDAELWQRSGEQLRIPAINGHEMFKMYRDYEGPGNIPKDLCWKLHNELKGEPLDLKVLSKEDEDKVVMDVFATACYTECSVPLLYYLAARKNFDFKEAVLANVNAGGDSVHRGAILGVLLGASSGGVPDDLKRGLKDYDAISKEIDAFVDVALSGKVVV